MTEKEEAEAIYKSMKGFRVTKRHQKKCTLVAIDLLIDNSAQNPYAFEHYKKVRAVAEEF